MLKSMQMMAALIGLTGMTGFGGNAMIRPMPSLVAPRRNFGRSRIPGPPQPAGSKLVKAAERRRIGISNIH